MSSVVRRLEYKLSTRLVSACSKGFVLLAFIKEAIVDSVAGREGGYIDSVSLKFTRGFRYIHGQHASWRGVFQGI